MGGGGGIISLVAAACAMKLDARIRASKVLEPMLRRQKVSVDAHAADGARDAFPYVRVTNVGSARINISTGDTSGPCRLS